MVMLKFFRRPTEETFKGSKPGESTRATVKRRRKDMLKKLMAKLQSEEGQGLVEYALIIVLVSVALIAALGFLAGGINNAYSMAVSALNP
jgi:pilus assembly protein Flp/PilA